MSKIFNIKTCKNVERRMDSDFKTFVKVYNEIWEDVDKVVLHGILPNTTEDKIKLFARALVKYDVINEFKEALHKTRDEYQDALDKYDCFFATGGKPTRETQLAYEQNVFINSYAIGLIAEVESMLHNLKETERIIYASFDLKQQEEIAKGVDGYRKRREVNRQPKPKDLECSAR